MIAATVIGGANLMGGAGGAYGAVVGSALLEVIRNALLMAGIDSNWQGAFVGAFIILAVLIGMETRGFSLAGWCARCSSSARVARTPTGETRGTTREESHEATAGNCGPGDGGHGRGLDGLRAEHLRPRAEEHEQPVLRPGPRRLQEGRKEIGGKIDCDYIGPGEHGGGDEQVQIVQDLIAEAMSRASPSRPPTRPPWPWRCKAAKDAGIPVVTWDSDLLPENQDLRVAYIGTHNYDIGVNIAKLVQAMKPEGGTICIQSGGAAAANHNERMQGIRDTLRAARRTSSPGDR